MATIKTYTNTRGIKYALVSEGETFGVWKLCENYAAHIRGGIAKTWRYVEKGMTKEAAEKLFNRRTGTK